MTATIVHATDLIHDDHVAFEHAVALALASGARLVSLHAGDRGDISRMPDAAAILASWGQAPTAIEFERTVHDCCDEPVETILDAIDTIAPRLVIAATHERSALARFLGGSHAEAIAHNARAPTLLFPIDSRGFLGTGGRVELGRVLVPIGDAPAADSALRAASWFATLAGAPVAEWVLLHVGSRGAVAAERIEHLERQPGSSVRRVTLEGNDIERSIVGQAASASLIIMATRGHDSLGDVLRGSHTDRVLREARCPVLSVGVGEEPH